MGKINNNQQNIHDDYFQNVVKFEDYVNEKTAFSNHLSLTTEF